MLISTLRSLLWRLHHKAKQVSRGILLQVLTLLVAVMTINGSGRLTQGGGQKVEGLLIHQPWAVEEIRFFKSCPLRPCPRLEAG